MTIYHLYVFFILAGVQISFFLIWRGLQLWYGGLVASMATPERFGVYIELTVFWILFSCAIAALIYIW